jgi:hypothetical protein
MDRINSYKSASQDYQILDLSDGQDDGKVTLSAIPEASPELRSLDANNDKLLSFFEYLGAYNKGYAQIIDFDPQEALVLYDLLSSPNYNWPEEDITRLIDYIIETQRDEEVPAILGLLPDIIKAGINSPGTVTNLLVDLEEYAGRAIIDALKAMPAAIESLKQNGINDTPKLNALLIKIIRKSNFYCDEALKELPAALGSLRKAGIKDPAIIEDFVVLVLEKAGVRSNEALKALPQVIASLIGAQITDSKNIMAFLLAIAPAKRSLYGIVLEAVPAMFKAGITKPQEINARVEAAEKAAGNKSRLGVKALSPMVEAGIREPKNIKLVIEAVIKPSSQYAAAALKALPALVRAGIKEPKKITEIITLIIKLSGGYTNDVLAALPGILSSARGMKYDEIKNNLAFLITYGRGHRFEDIAYFFRRLKLDFSKCNQKQFSSELCERINKYSAWDNEFAQKMAIFLNTLQENEWQNAKTDKLITAVIRGFNSKSSYQLLALGGADLNKVTFSLVWGNLRIDDLRKLLTAVDPDNKYLTKFTLALCAHDKLDIIIQNSSLFLKEVIDILSHTEDILYNTSLLIKVLDKIIPVIGEDDKLKFADFLKDGAKKHLSQEHFGVIIYLIKLYGLQLGDAYLADLVPKLPPILSPAAPRDYWLADGVLTAKQYFYQDENWYEISQGFCLQNGYIVDNEYMESRSIDASETTVYVKKVKDRQRKEITLRIIITKASYTEDNRADSLRDPEIDILVHRGHNLHIFETFVSGDFRDQKKLFIGGSCGAFSSMISDLFLQSYAGNYFIADKGLGQGTVNNDLVVGLMERLAAGETTWEKLIDDRFLKHGIVRPNDPSFLILEYVKRVILSGNI